MIKIFYSVLLGFCAIRANDLTLPNGRVVKNIEANKYIVAGEKALIIKYESKYDIYDVESLRHEAEEIWPFVYPEIARSGFNLGYLQATEPKKSGLISIRKNFSFKVWKDSIGNWQYSEKTWGKNYTESANVKAKEYIGYLLKAKYKEMAGMHYLPDSLKQNQRTEEIKGLSESLAKIFNSEKVIEVTSSAPQANEKSMVLVSMDRYWWQKRPPVYMCGYSVKTDTNTYFTTLAFSLINSELQLAMIMVNKN